jgi:hypothetical protein
MPDTIAQRFTLAFGGNDTAALTALYDEDVVLYGPLTWPLRGRAALLDYVGEFIGAYNPRIVLHDEFYDAAGTRGCFTFVFHWHNTEPFYGHEPTGERGVMVETHAITIRDGRIVAAVGRRQLLPDALYGPRHLRDGLPARDAAPEAGDHRGVGRMRIGVIGAGGSVGAAARLLARAGHELLLSYSRDPDKLRAQAEEIGAQAGTPAEAAAFGDVVILAVPWPAIDDAVAQAGSLDGRIVIDTTNPFGAGGWAGAGGQDDHAGQPGAPRRCPGSSRASTR